MKEVNSVFGAYNLVNSMSLKEVERVSDLYHREDQSCPPGILIEQVYYDLLDEVGIIEKEDG